MADANIKKVRIPFNNLPPINSETAAYSVKYRILSDDKNRSSHWSPIYSLTPAYKYVPGDIKFFSDNSAKVASFTWDPVNILKPNGTYVDITNKLLSNKLATLTTSGAHYMSPGDWVTISDVGAPFNGTYKITTTPTSTTFTYYINNGNISSTAVNPSGTRIVNSFVAIAPEYDIWIRWGRVTGTPSAMTGDWIYKERVSATSVSYPHATFYTVNNVLQSLTPNHVGIVIYIPGNPIPIPGLTPTSSFLNVYYKDENAI